MLKLFLIIIVFILGLYFSCNYTSKNVIEGFDISKNSCPNILIQKGTELYLHNSRRAKIPGVNPVKFNNLEEYVEFLDWQRSQNISCPVLFLQHSYDTQGKPIYKFRPSPTDLQGGLPPTLTYGSDSQAIPLSVQKPPETKLIDANRDDPPYNNNSYPGYDPMNMYEGEYTPLDKMFHEQEGKGKISTNPMDVNWGGVKYTESAVKSGEYKGDYVYKTPAS
tara:strand:- start:307 stop:969 length:663 start_codon:yes stop_codon:yes gene_type:complete